MKHSRPPDLKSSSNVSLPFTWITGPTTDPICFQSYWLQNWWWQPDDCLITISKLFLLSCYMSCWTLTTCHRLAFHGLWSRPLVWSCRVIKNHQKARQCRLGHKTEKRIEKARVLAEAERVSQVTVNEPPPYIIGVRKWHSNTEWFKMMNY